MMNAWLDKKHIWAYSL